MTTGCGVGGARRDLSAASSASLRRSDSSASSAMSERALRAAVISLAAVLSCSTSASAVSVALGESATLNPLARASLVARRDRDVGAAAGYVSDADEFHLGRVDEQVLAGRYLVDLRVAAHAVRGRYLEAHGHVRADAD